MDPVSRKQTLILNGEYFENFFMITDLRWGFPDLVLEVPIRSS